MTTRRSFLRGLLSLGATAAAGVAIVEPEPVRRYWQVGRGAPVLAHGAFDRALRKAYGDKIDLFGYTYDSTAQAFSLEQPVDALDDHRAHIARHSARRWAWMEPVSIHTARITGIKS